MAHLLSLGNEFVIHDSCGISCGKVVCVSIQQGSKIKKTIHHVHALTTGAGCTEASEMPFDSLSLFFRRNPRQLPEAPSKSAQFEITVRRSRLYL